MPKLLLTAIASAILLLIPLSLAAQEANPQLTGTVAYRERVALPSDAVIDIQLLDTSIADVAAQTIAEVLINAEGRQVPVPFTLTYDPAKIVSGNRYSARATIRSGDGMLMFSSTQAYPVLTHGAPSKVNLILHTVGHGAKPGAAAKKQAAAAASEATASSSQSSPPATTESAPVTTAASPSPEPPPIAVMPSPPRPQERPALADERPAQTETAAGPPPSTPLPDSTSTPVAPSTESAPSQAASPTGDSASQAPAPQNIAPRQETVPTPATTGQQTSPAEPPPAATPDAPTAQPESRPAEASPSTSGATTPPDSKIEPTTPTPEAKVTEPEAPLPEAPSASRRAELEANAPESAEPEPESSSRPERPAPNKALTPLADTQWKLIQLGGADVVITPPQKPVTLAFSPEGRRIAGSAGCNSYLGTFLDDHGRLRLSPGNMTMMACVDPAGSRERKFIAMLRSADGYRISGGFLLLTSNGKTVAKFHNNQF